MSDEQKRGVGRPPKLTLDEKKDIVNRYLIQQGNDPSVLRAYGVNARLANFAKSLDSRYLCVRGYDFSEDEIQHYMLRLGRELSVEDQAKLVGCAYTPLDFGVVSSFVKGKKLRELLDLLKEREGELLTIYKQAANSMALYGVLEAKYEAAESLSREYKAQNTALSQQLLATQTKLEEERGERRRLQEENGTLRRTIKQNENQIAVLTSKGLAKGIGITDDIKALMRKSGNEDGEEHNSGKCKVLDFLPDLEDR